MKNQTIEKPKNTVLLYREVISGAWKNWTDDEVEVNISQLKKARKTCISVLQDDLQDCVKEQIVYDHKMICKAVDIIVGKSFDGRIEPKYIDANMSPFVVKYEGFRRETVEPVGMKQNIPFLVFCIATVIGVLVYISIT